MQFEINITLHDLEMILTDVAGKPSVITLTLKGKEELVEAVNILDFDAKSGVLTICKANETFLTRKISYLEIECMEFESFFKYKSAAAKNFIVE